jgi:hypothetical protein
MAGREVLAKFTVTAPAIEPVPPRVPTVEPVEVTVTEPVPAPEPAVLLTSSVPPLTVVPPV